MNVSLDTVNSMASLFQSAIIIVAAAFAVYEFFVVRRLSPRIQLDVDFDIHCVSEKEGRYMLIAELEMINKGSVRKYLPEIEIRVGTSTNDELEEASNQTEQLKFSHTLVKLHNIVGDPMDPWWIDPGVKQIVRHPVVIEKLGAFVCLEAQVFYYKPPRKCKKLYKDHQELRKQRNEASKLNHQEMHKITAELKKFKKNKIDYHRASRIKPVLK